MAGILFTTLLLYCCWALLNAHSLPSTAVYWHPLLTQKWWVWGTSATPALLVEMSPLHTSGWEKMGLGRDGIWFLSQWQTFCGTLAVQRFMQLHKLFSFLLSSIKSGEVAWKLCSDDKYFSVCVVPRHNSNKVTRLWNFGLLNSFLL